MTAQVQAPARAVGMQEQRRGEEDVGAGRVLRLPEQRGDEGGEVGACSEGPHEPAAVVRRYEGEDGQVGAAHEEDGDDRPDDQDRESRRAHRPERREHEEHRRGHQADRQHSPLLGADGQRPATAHDPVHKERGALADADDPDDQHDGAEPLGAEGRLVKDEVDQRVHREPPATDAHAQKRNVDRQAATKRRHNGLLAVGRKLGVRHGRGRRRSLLVAWELHGCARSTTTW
mmetsp:Transcript_46204/g.130083  ORF Transcript_46204/g.130083 Transcript_46204/m.130083 type:complete len:231 (+) Transcript_46204:1024-1716(+)